jgi:hypothetical protein
MSAADLRRRQTALHDILCAEHGCYNRHCDTYEEKLRLCHRTGTSRLTTRRTLKAKPVRQ